MVIHKSEGGLLLVICIYKYYGKYSQGETFVYFAAVGTWMQVVGGVFLHSCVFESENKIVFSCSLNFSNYFFRAMKKFALTTLAALTLAATAQAGEDYSAKTVAPAPVSNPCLWTWFAGGSVGYLNDMDTEMYTLHVGAEYKCDDISSHAVFLEVGYANPSKSHDDQGTRYNIDIDMTPITMNYKYERQLVGNLNWYAGAGAGLMIINSGSNFPGADFSETEFLGQLFGGLVYNVSDSFEVFGGARYLYMTDDNLDNLDVYGDDWFYELGVRFNF